MRQRYSPHVPLPFVHSSEPSDIVSASGICFQFSDALHLDCGCVRAPARSTRNWCMHSPHASLASRLHLCRAAWFAAYQRSVGRPCKDPSYLADSNTDGQQLKYVKNYLDDHARSLLLCVLANKAVDFRDSDQCRVFAVQAPAHG